LEDTKQPPRSNRSNREAIEEQSNRESTAAEEQTAIKEQ
jgi:hypothetical protein